MFPEFRRAPRSTPEKLSSQRHDHNCSHDRNMFPFVRPSNYVAPFSHRIFLVGLPGKVSIETFPLKIAHSLANAPQAVGFPLFGMALTYTQGPSSCRIVRVVEAQSPDGRACFRSLPLPIFPCASDAHHRNRTGVLSYFNCPQLPAIAQMTLSHNLFSM